MTIEDSTTCSAVGFFNASLAASLDIFAGVGLGSSFFASFEALGVGLGSSFLSCPKTENVISDRKTAAEANRMMRTGKAILLGCIAEFTKADCSIVNCERHSRQGQIAS